MTKEQYFSIRSDLYPTLISQKPAIDKSHIICYNYNIIKNIPNEDLSLSDVKSQSYYCIFKEDTSKENKLVSIYPYLDELEARELFLSFTTSLDTDIIEETLPINLQGEETNDSI